MNFCIIRILVLVQVANAGLLTLVESAIAKVAGKGTMLADEAPVHKLLTELPSGAKHPSEGGTASVNFLQVNTSRFLAKCKEMEANAAAKALWDLGASEVSQCLGRKLTTGSSVVLAISTFTLDGK